MVLHFNGRYRSAIECKFLEQVEEELTNFWNSCCGSSVLVFPPLSARYRFLIHQLVGADSKLQTVSVGQGRQRRTIVYLASKREPEKMAQSPSTSQRTFFGRGRGRRPKRPDQALYVPGALRQAKLNRVKQNQDGESVTNATENKEIAKSNEDGNSSAHEEKMDGSSSHSIVDSGVDKMTMEKDSTSLNSNVQHTETPRRLSETVNERLQSGNKEPIREDKVQHTEASTCLSETVKERLQSGNKESNREHKVDYDEGLVAAIAAAEKSVEGPNIKSEDTTQFKGGQDKGVVRAKGRMSSTDDQSVHVAFGLESSNVGSDCSKDEVVNCGISQTLSTTATKGINSVRADESLLTPAVEKSDDLSGKPFVENITLPGQDPCELNAKEDCESATTELPTEGSKSLEAKNQSSEDGPSLELNGDAILVEQNLKTEDKPETQETADCSSGDVASDVKVEQGKSWNGDEVMSQHDSLNIELEHNEDLISACNGGFDHTVGQKPAVTHYEKDVKVLESKELKQDVIEETELRTSKVASTSVCENIVNSEESVTHTSDIERPPISVESENLEAECRLSDHISALSVTDEKVLTEEKTEDVPEVIENVGELETEQQKTSKKKKVKKDKSKDFKEDKVKSKDKGEKKKKKEKKSGKEKSSNEEKLDSEMQIKEKKKSKTKEERSAKQQSTCDTGNKKELTQESCAKSGNGDIDDDDDWEAIFDESGDCLNSEYLEELSRLTGISNPEVHKTQFDYYSFKPKEFELDDEEFGHILEIYNFSSELTTQDLMQALSSFRSKGFDIKWVDDTHALAVFASRHSAQDAMKMCSGPLMKLRPVSEGTAESKKKAHYCFEFLQPYRERPQTSKLLADRLVTGALGMRSKMTREERVKEREKIKEAKSKRQQEKIQKAQIWGD